MNPTEIIDNVKENSPDKMTTRNEENQESIHALNVPKRSSQTSVNKPVIEHHDTETMNGDDHQPFVYESRGILVVFQRLSENYIDPAPASWI